jgi:ligand-binding sensor domain-containing protein
MTKQLMTLVVSVLMLVVCGCKDKESIEPVFEISLIGKSITAIAFHEKDVWIGTGGDGLFKKDGETWINYTELNGLPSNHITALAISDNGIVLVGTSMGLSKYENEQWITFTEETGFPARYIYTLYFDNHGNLLIGHGNNSYTIYNGSSFSTIEVSGTRGHVHAIAVDSDENIWIGSCGTGLSMFDGQVWAHSIHNLTVFAMEIFISSNGDIWVGGPYGAHRFNGNTWTTYKEADGLANNYTVSFAEDHQGNIWIGTNKGLSIFNGTDFTTYSSDIFLLLVSDNDRNIWAVDENGLSIITPQDLK